MCRGGQRESELLGHGHRRFLRVIVSNDTGGSGGNNDQRCVTNSAAVSDRKCRSMVIAATAAKHMVFISSDHDDRVIVCTALANRLIHPAKIFVLLGVQVHLP